MTYEVSDVTVKIAAVENIHVNISDVCMNNEIMSDVTVKMLNLLVNISAYVAVRRQCARACT